MMAQWHPTKNPQFDVYTTPAGLREKAWWLCRKCGYEWQALISTRKESKGYCPRCDKDKQGPKTKTTIAMVPHLIDFWDFDANPDMDPYTLTATKNRDANWKCPVCGHKWTANIHNRYYDKTGCPACAGTVATEKNNALVRYPDLEYYYDHDYPENPPLESLLPTSSTVVHWRCPDCGYKWEQPVVDRIKNGIVKSCAICTGARIKGTYADEYPEAAEMYSPENTVLFHDLHAKDRTTIFLWDCPNCGYEFESTLGSMLILSKRPHKGCPACLGKVIAPPGESVADLYPELLEELDDDTDLFKLLPNSSKEVSWKCKTCGYKWTTTIALRSMGFGKCAVCNNIRPVKGHNTVADLFYDIAKQWAPSNNLKADELLPGSTEWVKLVCPDCGIEHSVQICQATAGNIQCPYCSGAKAIPGVNSLKAVHEDWLRYWDYENNSSDPDHIRADASSDCFWICDNGHHYTMKITVRTRFIEEGRELCPYCDERLPIPGTNSLKALHPEWVEELDPENKIDPDTVFESYSHPLLWICKEGHHYPRTPLLRLQDEAEGRESCPFCDERTPTPGVNTLKILHPEWMYEFDPENTVDPDTVFETYTFPLLWICKEGHHYPRSPLLRLQDEAEGRNSCPFCDERAAIPGVNSLKALHPEWMDEFDSENTVDPDTVFETYTQPLLWICKEGHHYPRSPLLRLQDEALNRESCPICDDRQVQPGVNSFAAKHKDLLAEWDYVSNYVIADPDHISDKSNIKVWFRCMKDPTHENYGMSVATRVLFKERGHNPCPTCKGRRRKKKHFV